MMHHAALDPVDGTLPAGAQHGRLCAVLRLVERMAGIAPAASDDAALDEAARLTSAYTLGSEIARRRYNALASETAGFAAAGIAALLRIEAAGGDPAAAATQLALELRRATVALAQLLR